MPTAKKDLTWWMTSLAPVTISIGALIVAFFALLDQHTVNSATEAGARAADASLISIWQTKPSGKIEVQNLGQAPAYDVWVKVGIQAKGNVFGGGGYTGSLGEVHDWSVVTTPRSTTYST
jgi:hypothetical protein